MKLCCFLIITIIITINISFLPFVLSSSLSTSSTSSTTTTTTCDVLSIDESQDSTYNEQTLSLRLIESTIQRAISHQQQNSMFAYDNYVVYTRDFFVYIFKDIECINVPEIETISYIANDISQFITVNRRTHPQLVNVFVGLYRTDELTPQSFYYVYDKRTRQQIKANNLQNTNHEVVTNNTVFISNVSSLIEHYNNNKRNGVNVFHANETAFNDHCVSFYDKQTNMDVVLADRRKYLYIPLCDVNHTLLNVYISDDSTSIKATCKSTIYDIMTSEIKLNRVNGSIDAFFENEVEIKNGLYTFTCGKEAFTSKLIVSNFAFWLVMAFIVVQAVVMVVYFVTDFEGKCREYLEFLDNKVQVCVNEGDENANNGVISYLRRRSTLRATQRRRSKMMKTLAKINGDDDVNGDNAHVNAHTNVQTLDNVNMNVNVNNNNNNGVDSNVRLNIKMNTPETMDNRNSHIDLEDGSNSNSNNKNDIVLDLRSPKANPPKKNNDNDGVITTTKPVNNNNIESNNDISNTIKHININTETVEPILRKKPKLKHKKTKVKINSQDNLNGIRLNSIDQSNNISNNINIGHFQTSSLLERKQTTNTTTTKPHRSNTISRRSSKLTSKRNSIIPRSNTSSRKSSHRMSTIIVDSNFNAKQHDPHELITLPLYQACELDQRSVMSLFGTTLCDKLFLINLCNYNDTSEPLLLRIFAFVFDITCLLFLSALFFNENYLSTRFVQAHTNNKNIHYGYIWTNESPKSAYAALVAVVLIMLMNFGTRTRKELTRLHVQKTEKNFEELKSHTFHALKVKHIIVFVVDMLLMILFWYYCSCFCSLFSQTQVDLVLTTINTAIYCVVFILFIYLLFCIMRVYSLECKSNCLYQFSSFFL